jgi:hypothetical protein
MNTSGAGEDKTPPTQQAHCCPDWDFMLIRPGDVEMEVCTCPVADEPSEIARAVVPGGRCRCLYRHRSWPRWRPFRVRGPVVV